MIQLSFYGNTLTRRFTHPSKAQVCKAQPHIFYRKFFYKLSKAAINTQQRCLSVVLSMYAQTRIRVFLFRQSVHQNQKNSTTAVQCTLPPIPFTTNVAFLTEDPNISLMTSFTRKRCSLNYYWMKKGFISKDTVKYSFF